MSLLTKFAHDLSNNEISFDEAVEVVSADDLVFMLDKEAAIAPAANVLKGLIGKGTEYLAKNTARDAALVGAAGGGVRQALDPGINPYTGETRSRIGGFVRGATKGAIVGAGAVHGARAINPVMQGSKTWGQAGQAVAGSAAKTVQNVSAKVNKAAKTIAKPAPPTAGG